MPASANALVGVKPTIGLVSRYGIVPVAHSFDTAGPLARTVADAAILLTAMMGTDPNDTVTADSQSRALRNYVDYLDPNGLAGARIGVVRNTLFGYNDAADHLADDAIAVMKGKGATIVDPANIPSMEHLDGMFDVMLYEFKADLNRYLAWLGSSSPVHSLDDVIAFNTDHKDQELRYFGQKILVAANKKGPLTEQKYSSQIAQTRQRSRTLGIDAVMTRFKLDALIAPTAGPAWLTDTVRGDWIDGGSPMIAAAAGYPHITVPAGQVRGLPVGISFFGRAWSEPTLFKLAYAYEQRTKHRHPPKFAQIADISPED
jgi:amidase